MKNIVFVAHLSEVSGAGVALVNTVAALQESVFHSTLVLPGSGDLVAKARSHNVEPVIIDNPEFAISEAGVRGKLHALRKRFDYTRRLARLLRETRADICYVNSGMNIFPAFAARMAGVPIVWHIHETFDHNDLRSRIKRYIIRRFSKGLIYASSSGLNTLPHPTGIPYLIMRNYVDLDNLLPIGRERIASSQTTPAKVLSNGTFHRKAPDVLLKAAMQLDNVPDITIIGPRGAEDEFGNSIQTLAESPALTNRVEFAGLVTSLIPYYKSATVFVSASRNEALPIAIVEAMAAGVPVIATDVGDCAELLDHGKCGWVVPSDSPEALAAALAEVLQNQELAQQKATFALNKIQSMYGTESFWSPLITFINNIAR